MNKKQEDTRMTLPRKIVSRDGNHVGKCTGSTRPCRLAGCTGLQIRVLWDDGKVTYPCTKGMEFSQKGRVARLA